MRRLIIGVAVVVLGAILVLGLLTVTGYVTYTRGNAQAGGEDHESLPSVALDLVVSEARVVPIRHADLAFTTSGVVAEVLVDEGSEVEAGDVLVRLDPGRLSAAVSQAEADLRRSQARLAELQAGSLPEEIEIMQAAFDAAQAGFSKVKHRLTQEDLVIAEAEVRQAAAELSRVKAGPRTETIAMAEAEVTAARAALDQAMVALKEAEIRAPFSGVVATLAVTVGEYVAPGVTVARLADFSSWRIETVDLTELGIVKVTEGSPVRVTFDAMPDLEIPGTVTRIAPHGENRHGDITYTVTVTPDRQDPRLRWNMTACVSIEGKK